jgi:hypothetical protein
MIFSFIDGVYYVKYNPEIDYTVRDYCRNKRTGIVDKVKPYVFIPVSDLRPFSAFKY